MIPSPSIFRNSLSGAEIRSIMRRRKVTIRRLAEFMSITHTRVLHVRKYGLHSRAYVYDWMMAIREINEEI